MIGVPPVADVEDAHGVSALIDGVANAVFPAACAPVALEGVAQRSAHAMGVVGQWPVEEFHAGRGDGLGQMLGELACRGTGYFDPVGHSGWVRALLRRCALELGSQRAVPRLR